MELFGLDEKFNVVGQLVPDSIQWNRKFNEAGDYVLKLDASQYDPNMFYIFSNERKELGLINKLNWKSDTKGESLEISGFFAERLLDDSVIYPTYYANGNISDVCQDMIEKYVNLNVAISKENIAEKVIFQETGDKLGTRIYELLKAKGASVRIWYDITDMQLKLDIYKGKDRTQGNNDGLNFVSFATSWDNIREPNVITDNSDFCNYAIVGGQGEGADRTFVIVDHSQGKRKKMVYVDSRNSQFDESKQTWQEYLDMLKQEGEEELLNHAVINNVDFKPLHQGYEYMVDYELGDLCDCIIEPIDLVIQGRIIAIYEVFEKGVHSIEIELGEQIVSKIKKLERGLIR